MIFPVNNATTELKLKISNNAGPLCCKDVRLEIEPLVCDKQREYKWYNLCNIFKYAEAPEEPTMALVYEMFDTDENGFARFVLDENFYDLPCGRYKAKVIVCGCYLTTFQIDKRERRQLQKVVVNGTKNCCGGSDDC